MPGYLNPLILLCTFIAYSNSVCWAELSTVYFACALCDISRHVSCVKIPNPDEAEKQAGRKMVYDTWAARYPAIDGNGQDTVLPK